MWFEYIVLILSFDFMCNLSVICLHNVSSQLIIRVERHFNSVESRYYFHSWKVELTTTCVLHKLYRFGVEV